MLSTFSTNSTSMYTGNYRKRFREKANRLENFLNYSFVTRINLVSSKMYTNAKQVYMVQNPYTCSKMVGWLVGWYSEQAEDIHLRIAPQLASSFSVCFSVKFYILDQRSFPSYIAQHGITQICGLLFCRYRVVLLCTLLQLCCWQVWVWNRANRKLSQGELIRRTLNLQNNCRSLMKNVLFAFPYVFAFIPSYRFPQQQ